MVTLLTAGTQKAEQAHKVPGVLFRSPIFFAVLQTRNAFNYSIPQLFDCERLPNRMHPRTFWSGFSSDWNGHNHDHQPNSLSSLFSACKGWSIEQLDNYGTPLILHNISAFVQIGTVAASVTGCVISREVEGLMYLTIAKMSQNSQTCRPLVGMWDDSKWIHDVCLFCLAPCKYMHDALGETSLL